MALARSLRTPSSVLLFRSAVGCRSLVTYPAHSCISKRNCQTTQKNREDNSSGSSSHNFEDGHPSSGKFLPFLFGSTLAFCSSLSLLWAAEAVDQSQDEPITAEQLNTLIDAAFSIKDKSYSPYSKFRVGVALLGEDGRVYAGTNVENASYGLTICAERTAICNAVCNGCKSFKAIVVSTDVVDEFKWCCGACGAFILEFGEDIPVFSVKPDRSYTMRTIRELLPYAFSPKDLPGN